jgi:Tol biopolymer transport system component
LRSYAVRLHIYCGTPTFIMRKPFTLSEKLIIAAPLIAVSIGGLLWQLNSGADIGQLTGLGKSLNQSSSTRSSDKLTVDFDKVSGFEFSPDEKRLVVIGGYKEFHESNAAKPIGFVYDLEQRRKVSDLNSPSKPISSRITMSGVDNFVPTFSPSGNFIIMNSNPNFSGKFVIWDSATGVITAEYSNSIFQYIGVIEEGEAPVIFLNNSDHLLLDIMTRKTLDLATGEVKLNHDESINFSRGGKRFTGAKSPQKEFGLTSTFDFDYSKNKDVFRLTDLRLNKIIWEPSIQVFGKEQWLGDVLCVSNNAQQAHEKVSGASNIWLYDLRNRKLLTSPSIPLGARIADFSLNPDKATLAYSTIQIKESKGKLVLSSVLNLWNYRENKVVWSKETGVELIKLNWSPDGKKLVAFKLFRGHHDHTDTETVCVFDSEGNQVYDCEIEGEYYRFSPNSKSLAVRSPAIDKGENHLSKSIEIKYFEE